jgi:hypothetical protein
MQRNSKRRSNGAQTTVQRRAELAALRAAQRGAAAQAANIAPGAFKLEEARHYLGGLSALSLYRLVERGLLRPNRATRHLLFSKVELDRFLADHMT